MERFLQKMDLAVFLALVAGCTKVGEIAEHCGHSAFRVREALKRLLERSLVERVDYRTWGLADSGHALINELWISYVELFGMNPEAHEMIASTIAEAHKMIVSDSQHGNETHKTIASSAQNDRFSLPFMHVNDHACMDDVYSLRNTLADSVESVRNPRDELQNRLADSEQNPLEEELKDIGFDQPGQWLRKENVSWELVSDWLEYVSSNGGIRNKAGFIRRQVEAGEKPNLVKARRRSIPAEYEGLFKR